MHVSACYRHQHLKKILATLAIHRSAGAMFAAVEFLNLIHKIFIEQTKSDIPILIHNDCITLFQILYC